ANQLVDIIHLFSFSGHCQQKAEMQDTELALLMDRFMRRIHFGLQAKAHSFDTAKVGPGGGIVLLTIAEMGRPELHELTNRVARDKSQMTRTIRSLETKGLVSRTTSPRDARVSLICLTEAGEQSVKSIQEAVAETISEILAPISKSEEDVLKTLLQRALSEDGSL
ncbi:MAG: MarR family transcriptional regulator, partial [Pseudomonadota bacterium]